MTNNNIPKGYKQTEIGVIPEDWDMVRLGDIAKKIGDGLHGTPIYLEDSDIYFINGNNLVKGKIVINQNTKKVDYNSFEKNYKGLNEFTLLISLNGTIGNIAKYKNEKVMLGKSVGYFNFDSNIDFYFYILNSQKIQKFFISELTGSTIKNLSLQTLRKTKIPIPPKPEQQKIAKILTTWDNAIEQQQTLINQKQQLKKGLMQQLLTGKTRFTGFTDDWNFVKLGNLLDYEQPTKYLVADTTYNNGYEIPVLTAGKTFILGYTNETQGIFDNNLPVIIFDDFTTASKFVNFSFKAKSSAMKILKAKNKNINVNLVYELMQMINFTADDHKRYWISEYQELEIKIPSLPEQQKIAEVLINADKEIELLKNELNELKQQKKALMQKLLTGKVRIKL